ncbi:MAG: FCD domain-containing protein [Oscillospiraceae bacterium]|nr:FCD domain-containing protein [Oscillospiraceae bacterium]
MENESACKKINLYEQIADALEADIIARRYEDGRLPSEFHLAEQFNVSRTIIREAMKLLRERDLIDSKVGSGAYITKPEAQYLSGAVARIVRTNYISYAEIYDVRSILEREAAQKAALYIQEPEFVQMESCLAKLKDYSLTPEARREYDFAFHLAIARASRNNLLVMLIEAMSTTIKDVIDFSSLVEGSIDDGIHRHGLILRALREHDPILAGHMMYDHIYHSKQKCLQYFEEQNRCGAES